ncbi:MAG: patatin-like phospholipase family protein [Vicinamibacterales bacterium]
MDVSPSPPAPADERVAWALPELHALGLDGEPRDLRRGDVLMRQGDPSDVLYFVLSGRLAVHVARSARPVAEIGHGQPVGEIGFFAGLPRTATVTALRDSRVLAISRDQFERSAASSPRLRDVVIETLARRLAHHNDGPEGRRAVVRTVAIVAAGGSRPSAAWLDRLREVVGSGPRAMVLTERQLQDRFPGRRLDDSAVAAWLDALELNCSVVFYVAGEELSEWTTKCLRQADEVWLVGTAGAPTDLNPSERLACELHAPSARRLILLHPSRKVAVAGTSAWLASREVAMHHHVSLEDTADVHRLHRFLTGHAVGFVASGGGALGCAHAGAYKAFTEAGVDFDILGGTSAGAAMTAALLCGMDPDAVDEATHNIFVKSRAFRRLTLPRYGLIDHKVFDRALRAEYRDYRIEDLWKPYFAVSSNLSGHEARIHRAGPVWHAVRASGSLPGVLPPFFTEDGEMLVDGALRDNIPLGPMKAIKAGPNVVIRLRAPSRTTYSVDYDAIPGPRQLVGAMLTPWRRRRWPGVPSILQVILLSMFAAESPDVPVGDTDLVFTPDLPPAIRSTSWERHTEVFDHAYRSTATWLEDRLADGDPRVAAVVGGGAR